MDRAAGGTLAAGSEPGPGPSPARKRKRKRDLSGRSPMERCCRRYLKVTEVCGQSWCELQVLYGFEYPLVLKAEKERAEVKAGASIHLAREREVHDVVQVCVVTREDRQAVKFLNLLGMISALQTGCCVRELPAIGMLEGVFMVGVIDELRYSDKGELVLNELKTRRHKSLPSEAQAKGHRLQVGLYKLLFDGMVRGSLSRDQVVEHLELRLERALGPGVLEHARNLGFRVAAFGDVLDLLLVNLKYCELPCIDLLRLEYCHQGSGDIVGSQDVPFDEDQLRAQLRHYLSFWFGQREPRGVDIEDAWKCRMCSYAEHCEWRRGSSQGSVTVHTDKKLK
ncbi:exonuclease V-like [Scleropages formosus]|uniref:Exonuclease V n=1 Tax=Scleropages formosus TaxID=113540 RepID=A0A0N8K0R9_SCLFO|nr:exonuclease V-like [Scleropages formosus]